MKYNTIDYDEWVNDKNKNNNEKYKKIVNKIFFECLAYVGDDNFWKYKFKKMAYGNYPPSFFYKDDTLYKKKKTKIVSLKIDKNPEKAYNQVKEFLHEHGNIYSLKDLVKIDELTNEERNENENENENLEWKNFKSFYKNSMIYNYVEKLIDENKLNIENKYKLINEIKLSLYLKYLENDDFEIKDNNIINIKKLKYENGEYYVEKNHDKYLNMKVTKNKNVSYNVYNSYDSDYELKFFKK